MKKTLITVGMLCTIFTFSQTKKDSTKQKDIKEVVLVGKKPTIESKTDRTVFNVANSSILAGNTTWDVLRMSPLINIDNNDAIRAEGESVTVYINDRKSVFTGKELKEYLKTIPGENLMKIEIITSPSARYETTGAVVNIVLKKPENEGFKGSVSLTDSQSSKNSQYSNLNLNYHKKYFTQTLTGSYSDNTSVTENHNENLIYANNSFTKTNLKSTEFGKSPSFSSTSEFELNDKNNIGFITEYYRTKKNLTANSDGENYINNVLQNSYLQNQNLYGYNQNLGSNLFYKYYDKVKNKILDVNLGLNYDSVSDTNDHIIDYTNNPIPSGTRVIANNQNREYYLKVDYSQPVGKSGSQLEFGGKMDFKNNVIPYDFFKLANNQWITDNTRTNSFHYLDNLNSLYVNFSKTYFKKLETRIGLRYEYIWYKLKQDVGNIEKTNSYGTLLPDLLLKYSFTDNYNLTATYNHYLWRPWYSEFNPFTLPGDDGTIFYRGNMDLQPNPSDRFNVKFGIHKKYFISVGYSFTNQDYWDSFYLENGNTISQPTNFSGRVDRYSLNASTNQTFLKNKLNLNLNFGLNYTDNSDFKEKNNLEIKKYISNFYGSSNISYTNLFNKNINLNGWFGLFTQNYGNTVANKTNFFHNISITKIFPKTEMEASLQLNNIFMKPNFDITRYSEIGTFKNVNIIDWHGISLTFIKRFGNQNVKENTKTNVEKESGGSKN